MSSITRTDIYNRTADTAIETAIATMLAVEQGQAGGEGARPTLTNRGEALRFLVKRITRLDRVFGDDYGEPCDLRLLKREPAHRKGAVMRQERLFFTFAHWCFE